jgi:hypothetical protein
MSLVNLELKGERQAGRRFEDFPSDLREALKAEIDSLTNELHARVVAAAPSRSGNLRSRIQGKLYEDKDRVTGRVSVRASNQSEARKAAALEYGSRGRPGPVQSHTMRLDHYWSQKLAAPRTVVVEAFQRTARVAEHRFLRGPLDAMRVTINVRLGAVIASATKGASA